ncbi:MAG TPA: NnrU family protein [Aquabacterium sp.]|nr:NnrU family protein [Aquabacterium sp.]
MSALILGLVLFLGMHSVRIVADGTRSAFIARRGAGAWKGLYSVVSLAGFALILWGDGQARLQPVVLWDSPLWTRHLAGALMLPALVLLVAAQVPGNGIKARVHHPQVLAVKTWALAHLLANNTLADVLLFGGFGLWAVLDFRSARQRDRAAGTVYPPGQPARTALVVVLGLALWAVFAFGAHQWLFGVRPFGR